MREKSAQPGEGGLLYPLCTLCCDSALGVHYYKTWSAGYYIWECTIVDWESISSASHILFSLTIFKYGLLTLGIALIVQSFTRIRRVYKLLLLEHWQQNEMIKCVEYLM